MKQDELFRARAIPLPPPPPRSGVAAERYTTFSVEDTYNAPISSQSTNMSLPGIMKSSDQAELLTNMEANEKAQSGNFSQTIAIPLSHTEVAGKSSPPPYSVEDTHHGNTSQSTIISLPEIIEIPDETGSVKNMEFDNKTLRHGFIKKVYSILMTQLVLTGLVIFGFMQIPPFGVLFILDNFWQVYSAPLIIYITTFICIMCCEGPRRRVPWNYIFLLMFTISLSVMVGLVATISRPDEILIAAGITFTIVLALTLFAFQTKYDFTLLTGSGLCLSLALLMLGITMLTTSYDRMNLVYLTIGVFIISIYIVWDTQMIVGGGHRYAFSPEEYVFAALVLYIDIMYLFMRILRFMR